MKGERILIASGFILISIIWGSTWLAIKIGLESMSPLFAVALRFLLASLLLQVIMKIRGEGLPWNRSAVKAYLVLGFLSFSFPFALVYAGEQYIPSGLASIIFAVYPIVVAVGSVWLLPNEKLNAYKVAGILLGFSGVLVVFWSDISLADRQGLVGMGMVLASTLLQGTSLVLTKRIVHNISSMALTLGGMLFGVIILFVMAFLFEDVQALHFDGKSIGSILYLGTFGSVVTFVTYYWLLKRVQAVFLSLVSLITPILAVVLGSVWLQEQLAPRTLLGAAIVLLGIVIANGKEMLALLYQKKHTPSHTNDAFHE
jgi:drug/metabolite transporter (DMT)-like permease